MLLQLGNFKENKHCRTKNKGNNQFKKDKLNNYIRALMRKSLVDIPIVKFLNQVNAILLVTLLNK